MIKRAPDSSQLKLESNNIVNIQEQSFLPTVQDLEMVHKIITLANNAIDDGKVGIAALLLWRGEILAENHNSYVETQDTTAHAEMTVLRMAAKRLSEMNEQEKSEITIYSTLEPCLMCFSAIATVGIKRLVFSALMEDGSAEVWTAHGITCGEMNPLLVKGSIEIIEGVSRNEGKLLLERMGLAASK